METSNSPASQIYLLRTKPRNLKSYKCSHCIFRKDLNHVRFAVNQSNIDEHFINAFLTGFVQISIVLLVQSTTLYRV